ncbi:MAG: lytic transglycosylase domain-containing protein [Pseudomonadota bacterium]
MSITVPQVILAQTPEQQFKRLKVEDRQSGSRINVQIDEEAFLQRRQAQIETRNAPVETDDDPGSDQITSIAPTTPPVEGLGIVPKNETAPWFWDQFSPTLEDASVISLQKALLIGGSEAEALVPKVEAMQKLASTYGPALLRSGAEFGVSPALLLSVMYVESRGDPTAVSPAGAEGVMQLIPATADRFGVENAKDPTEAIRGAAAYMKFLIDEFGGDAVLALAGYNAGENAVLSHGGVPPYEETRNYIPKVVAAWRVAKGLCKGPHHYATDGCVFFGMG